MKVVSKVRYLIQSDQHQFDNLFGDEDIEDKNFLSKVMMRAHMKITMCGFVSCRSNGKCCH